MIENNLEVEEESTMSERISINNAFYCSIRGNNTTFFQPENRLAATQEIDIPESKITYISDIKETQSTDETENNYQLFTTRENNFLQIVEGNLNSAEDFMDYYSNQELKEDPRGICDIELYERQGKAS